MKSMNFGAPTNGLGISAFKEEVGRNRGANVLISPAAVSIAMAMVMSGAQGDTFKAIAGALGIPEPHGRSHLAYAALLAELLADLTASPEDSGVRLAVINAILDRSEDGFRAEFKHEAEANFQTLIASMQRSNEAQTVAAINRWAAELTRGQFTSVLDGINPQELALLLSAVSLEGKWTTGFDQSATTHGDFETLSGKKSRPFMTRTGYMHYRESNSHEGIWLPFGVDGRINLCILLPKPGVNLGTFVAGLDESSFSNELRQWSTGTVYLPRFALEYESDLTEPLRVLGLDNVFNYQTATLTAMTRVEPFCIRRMRQQAFLRCDEDGGEADAVTSVSLVSRIEERAPWVMRVNRPFVLGVNDTLSDTVWLAGLVNDPE